MEPRRLEDGARYATDGRRLLGLAVLSVALLIASAAAVIVVAAPWRETGAAPPSDRAVIVDQLAITDPNPEFVAAATRQLEAAGYHVDYIPSEAITVDFYRDLPARGYRFVILRSHTSDFRAPLTGSSDTRVPETSIGLFTNELYSRQTHLADQRALRLLVDGYADRDISSKYFGITPEFIVNSARGRFPGSTIVLMGCSGLKSNDLAQAFLARGAAEFVSWDESVTAEHTDVATEKLLTNLFAGGRDMREAVSQTMASVGPDPSFGARLSVYP